MTYRDVQLRFLDAARTGQVLDRAPSAGSSTTTPRTKFLPTDEACRKLGRVTTILEHLTGTSGRALEETDVTAYLPTLADHAGAAFAGSAAGTVRVVRSDARCVASTVLGQNVTAARLHVTPAWFTPAWRALADALAASTGTRAGGKSRRNSLSELHVLQTTALEHGIVTPAALPTDANSVRAWAGSDATLLGRLKAGLVAYRRARRLLPGPLSAALPACRDTHRPREYGLATLPNLEALLRQGFARLTPEEQPRFEARMSAPLALTMAEQIYLLAPPFGAPLDEFLLHAAEAGHAPGSVEKAVRALGHLVATMIREGIDPHTTPFADLWLKQVTPQAPSTAGRSRLDEGLGAPRPAGIPLLLHLLRIESRRRVANSPLVLGVAASRGDQPFFGPASLDAVRVIFRVARRSLEVRYRAYHAHSGGTERWQEIDSRQGEILKAISAADRLTIVSGHVAKELIPLNWAQLVLVVLRDLRRQVALADQALAAHFADPHSRPGSHGTVLLETRVRRALERYAIIACITADGMRPKQYANAIWNVHFRPTWVRDASGTVIGLSALSTHYAGDDCPSIRPKHWYSRKRGIRQPRNRDLPAGIVDLGLLFRYVMEVRAVRLREAGLLGPTDPYDPTTDRFAVFVSGEPILKKRTLPSRRYAVPLRDPSGTTRLVAPGNFTETGMRDLWGREILRVCRAPEAEGGLGRSDLPATLGECRRKGSPYRGLFGAHGVRSIGAWWWLGLRKDIAFAEAYTDDRRSTLEDHYAILPKDQAKALHKGGVHDPAYFTTVIDWMYEALADRYDWTGFWRAFDPFTYTPADDARLYAILTAPLQSSTRAPVPPTPPSTAAATRSRSVPRRPPRSRARRSHP